MLQILGISLSYFLIVKLIGGFNEYFSYYVIGLIKFLGLYGLFFIIGVIKINTRKKYILEKLKQNIQLALIFLILLQLVLFFCSLLFDLIFFNDNFIREGNFTCAPFMLLFAMSEPVHISFFIAKIIFFVALFFIIKNCFVKRYTEIPIKYLIKSMIISTSYILIILSINSLILVLMAFYQGYTIGFDALVETLMIFCFIELIFICILFIFIRKAVKKVFGIGNNTHGIKSIEE